MMENKDKIKRLITGLELIIFEAESLKRDLEKMANQDQAPQKKPALSEKQLAQLVARKNKRLLKVKK